MRLWQQHGESEAWLATADKLIAFEALESAHVALPQQGWRFIERSRRRVRRVTRIKQLAVCVIALLAIVASGAGWIASRKQHEAEYQVAQTLKAQSRVLTEAAAQRLKGSDVAARRASSSKCSQVLRSRRVIRQPQLVCFKKAARRTHCSPYSPPWRCRPLWRLLARRHPHRHRVG